MTDKTIIEEFRKKFIIPFPLEWDKGSEVFNTDPKTIESWLLEQLTLAEKQAANDICKMIDDMESKHYSNSSMDIWKLFKHIRNAIRDKYL